MGRARPAWVGGRSASVGSLGPRIHDLSLGQVQVGALMPYDPAFERALRGIAHGWHPKKGSLRKISPRKAKSMLSEAETVKGRRKALKEHR